MTLKHGNIRNGLLKTIWRVGCYDPLLLLRILRERKGVGYIGCTKFIRYNERKAEDTWCDIKKTCKPIICTEYKNVAKKTWIIMNVNKHQKL